MRSRLKSQDTPGDPTAQPAWTEPALPPALQTPLCPAGSLPLPPAAFTDPAKRAESLSCYFTYRPDTSTKVKAKLKVENLFTSESPFSAAAQTACDLYNWAFESRRRAPGVLAGGLSTSVSAPVWVRPASEGKGARDARPPHLGRLLNCFTFCTAT